MIVVSQLLDVKIVEEVRLVISQVYGDKSSEPVCRRVRRPYGDSPAILRRSTT